ncbi:MAG TPA: hypothetical protein VH598_06930, partial [Verrucomicrobiae bacterium]|nr:hypothetical protein [Verrucomicrobiae bacterium]
RGVTGTTEEEFHFIGHADGHLWPPSAKAVSVPTRKQARNRITPTAKIIEPQIAPGAKIASGIP